MTSLRFESQLAKIVKTSWNVIISSTRSPWPAERSPCTWRKGKKHRRWSKGDFINQKDTTYVNYISVNGISKCYTVKDNNEHLEAHIPNPLLPSPFFFFFFLIWEPWKITAGLTTDSLPVSPNGNFKVRLQKYPLFLHGDLQRLHFPFTIFFFLGSAVIYYSIINSLISPDLINLNFN